MAKGSIRNALTSIRNVVITNGHNVKLKKSRMVQEILALLLKEGLIDEISTTSLSSNEKEDNNSHLFVSLKYRGVDQVPIVTNIQLVSRPSLRICTDRGGIPKVLGGFGLIILSTSKGLITDREANTRKLGGEIICCVW